MWARIEVLESEDYDSAQPSSVWSSVELKSLNYKTQYSTKMFISLLMCHPCMALFPSLAMTSSNTRVALAELSAPYMPIVPMTAFFICIIIFSEPRLKVNSIAAAVLRTLD
jgi:hypothetical protein